ncbi:hypothetical protein AB4Z18_02380 [Leifsonia sp. 2TAF2]|uniref:hypothetical protein n=1 Tax=Leifsonia sp. 2TAF2 TaxID=3233009 RepID=UPI003F9AE3D6
MRHLDLLTDPYSPELLVADVRNELEGILAMHRYLVASTRREFEAAYERFLEGNDPESYDGGDAIWDAEQELGFNPWDIESHAGLMALVRAVSLCEVGFALLAKEQLLDPEIWVFPNGSTWTRELEILFFKTTPKRPFNVDGGGFRAIRSLRDLYVHGYGSPISEDRRLTLARRLYSAIPAKPITPEEEELGYSGEVYFFGEHTAYNASTKSLENELFQTMRADLSPLATYRCIQKIRDHFVAAAEAISEGLKDDLSRDNCKFVRVAQDRAARS